MEDVKIPKDLSVALRNLSL